MPAGFSRNRFAVPKPIVVCIVPDMLESWLPVTRPRMFWMPTSGCATPHVAALQKFAVLFAPILKDPKLWNRFDPLRVPPVMFHVGPAWLTVMPRPLDVM